MSFMSGFGTGLMNTLSSNMEASRKTDQAIKLANEEANINNSNATLLLARKSYEQKQKDAEERTQSIKDLSTSLGGDGVDPVNAAKAAEFGVSTFGSNAYKYVGFLQNYAKTGDNDFATYENNQKKEQNKLTEDRVVAQYKARADLLNNSLSNDPLNPTKAAAQPNIVPQSALPVPSMENPPEIETAALEPTAVPAQKAITSAPNTVASPITAASKPSTPVEYIKQKQSAAVAEGLPDHWGATVPPSTSIEPTDKQALIDKTDQVLSGTNQKGRELVMGVLDGTVPLSSMRKSESAQVMALAKQIDPDATPLLFKQHEQTVKDFGANTKIGQSINALKTITNHLDLLKDQTEPLLNGDYIGLNKVARQYKIQTGQSPQVVFDNIRNYLGSELARFYAGGVPTNESMQLARENLASYNSPEQLKDMIASTAGLVAGKVQAIDYDWDSRMGKMAAFRDPIGQDTRNKITNIAGKFAHEGAQQEQDNIKETAKSVPTAAIDMLKNNPALATAFETKYGVPASQYLGK